MKISYGISPNFGNICPVLLSLLITKSFFYKGEYQSFTFKYYINAKLDFGFSLLEWQLIDQIGKLLSWAETYLISNNATACSWHILLWFIKRKVIGKKRDIVRIMPSLKKRWMNLGFNRAVFFTDKFLWFDSQNLVRNPPTLILFCP